MFVPAVRLSGAAEVGLALGLDRRSCEKVLAAGLAGPVYVAERGSFVLPQHLAVLAGRPWVTSHPAALVIRLGPAEPDEFGRPFRGWHQHLAETDPAAQELAIDRYWAIRDPSRLHGGLVVFALATFVVDVRTLIGHQTVPGELRVLDLGPPGDRGAAFIGKRIKTGRGGNTVILQASE